MENASRAILKLKSPPASHQHIRVGGEHVCKHRLTESVRFVVVPFAEGTVGRYVGTMSTDKPSIAYLPSDF